MCPLPPGQDKLRRMAVPPLLYPPLQAFAADATRSRGRLVAEPSSPTRSEFHRDRDRIIHASAFRRLKHKTQVFIAPDGDHFRTRLTHTIEVAQIARSLARALGLDEDLAETLALAHDLGHTPFGHAGEDALDAAMQPYGGFDHNAQSLRIVTRLERRYAAFDGLNLTWETLEGLVKHNGPLTDADGQPVGRYRERGIPLAIQDYGSRHDLWLASHASAEAQAAAIADDIAYNAHDIDDGLRAGLISLSQLRQVPFLSAILDQVAALYPGLDASRTIHELVRRVITSLVEDAIIESQARIAALSPHHADDIRRASGAVIAFSGEMAGALDGLRKFLFAEVYRHPKVMVERRKAAEVVNGLFSRLTADPALMPDEWHEGLNSLDEARLARRVADFIAGMTDRYALELFARLTAKQG